MVGHTSTEDDNMISMPPYLSISPYYACQTAPKLSILVNSTAEASGNIVMLPYLPYLTANSSLIVLSEVKVCHQPR